MNRLRMLLATGLATGLAAVLAACAASHGDHSLNTASTGAGTTTAAVAAPAVAAVAPSPTHAPAASTSAQRPATTPCSTNTQRRYVYVSLRAQHMWLCERHRVAKDTPITSGMAGPDTRTPTGRFHIQGLNRDSVLTLNTGATYPVKYWIPFDAPLFGFHDSAWQHFPYGSPEYRTRGSHGCVHVPLAAITFLYHWAEIGTPVRIAA